MKTYSIETRRLGMTIKFTTVEALNALEAIEQVIAGLSVPPCNEYVARRVS